MSIFDPPSDPFGDEKRCRICDELLEYNPLVREWECTHDHEAAEQSVQSDVCHECGATETIDPYNDGVPICVECGTRR